MLKDIKLQSHGIWAFMLLVINALYLAFELAFNSRIVDSATGDFPVELVDALEVQGRVLSGIGLSLLLWRLLPTSPVSWPRQLSLATIVFIVAFCLMFFGQKVLIEQLVDRADGEARLDAQYLSVLKQGLAVNAIQVDDIQIPKQEQDSPSTKAFINIVGAMIYNSEDFIEHIKSNTDRIIDRMAQNKSLKVLPDAYQEYSQLGYDVGVQYQSYVQASADYQSALLETTAKANANVSDLYAELGDKWQASKSSLSREEKVRKSLEIKRGITDYFDGKQQCQKSTKYEQRCLIKLEQIYKDTIVAEAGRYVAPDYWCYPSREVMISKTIRGKQRSRLTKVQDCQSMDRKYLEQKLLALLGSADTFSIFMQTPEVLQRVNQQLNSDGIVMPTGWQLNDREMLDKVVMQQAKSKIDAEYHKIIIDQVGVYIEPGLDAESFVSLRHIQTQLRKNLAVEAERKVALNWSPEQFHHAVLKPRFISDYNARKAALLSESSELADGGSKAEQGRQYYRSIIVPPIAMGFSLFFGLFNLFAFISALLLLCKVPALATKTLVYGGGVLIFFVIPWLMPSSVVSSKAFGYFKQQMDASMPSIVGTASIWAVDAQPSIYPLGSAMASLVKQRQLEVDLIGWLSAAPEVVDALQIESELTMPVEDHMSKSVVMERAVEPSISKQPVIDTTALSDSVLQLGRRGLPLKGSAHPFSLKGVKEALTNDSGLIMDLIPIGQGEDSRYVVYDKPIVAQDVCLRGRRELDSLYHLKHSDWLSSTHGSCDVPLAQATKLPSMSRYLAAIKRHIKPQQQLIFTVHAPLTGEVYCNRVHTLLDEVIGVANISQINFSTTSSKVLGCLQSYPREVQFGFQFPRYLKDGQFGEQVDHSVISRKEWKRISTAEKGGEPGVETISVELLNSLLKGHASIGFVILDELHLNNELQAVADQEKIRVASFDANSVTWPTHISKWTFQ